MELVQNVLFKWEPSPLGIVPAKPIVRDLRWTVDSSGLISGRGIGSFLFIVQAIAVKSSGGNVLSDSVKIAAADRLHGYFALWRIADADVNAVRARGPDEKTAGVLT
jgi:hypothetical protein